MNRFLSVTYRINLTENSRLFYRQRIDEELVKSQKSSETLFFAYTEFEVMHDF